jgi:TolB-like protein/Flp pilus assembly protein TadD
MNASLAALRQRKVVQWGIVYVAGAWGLLQGLAYVSTLLHWPEQLQRLTGLALLIGLPVVLVLAWYHGDRGEQRVIRTELAILTLLFVLGGGIFWRYERAIEAPPAATTPAAAPVAAPTSAAKTDDARPSIAVLPFENRSDEHKDAFFVDGIHDDILTQLTKVSAMKVISRTSVERFRDTKLPMHDIAQQLGVTTILEGGVQRAGNRVRINVQLIDAATDAHLWAENYDRELTAANIFAIQSEVATDIAGALKTALTPGERARVTAVPTQNLDAWEAYQLGMQRMANRTTAGLAAAETFFRKAIELDPAFALAYVGLADSLAIRLDYADVQKGPTLDQAHAAVDAALKLDPVLGAAWAAAGLIEVNRARDDRAEQMFRRAIELNPNDAIALKWYGQLLGRLGRLEDSLRTLQSAATLDPLSALIQKNLAEALQQMGRFPEAAAYFRRAIAIDPSMASAYSGLGYLEAYGMNRFADGVPLVQKAAERDPGSPVVALSLALMYLDLDDEARSSHLLQLAQDRWPDNFYVNVLSALAGLLQGDRDSAVQRAKKTLESDPRDGTALLVLTIVDRERNDYRTARARYAKAYPELVAPGPPTMNLQNFHVAIDLASILQRTGESARAELLLNRGEQLIHLIPRLGYDGYAVEHAAINTLRGNTAAALAALREAERAGWRGPLWRFERDRDPNLASIRNEPEFKAIFADIERDMARQRAELAARPKDAPLNLELR